jgi:hypothetical protein
MGSSWKGGGKYGNAEKFSVRKEILTAKENSDQVGGILWLEGDYETFSMEVNVKADRPADSGIYVLSDGSGNGYQVRIDNWESNGNIGGIYCDGISGGIVANTGCFSEHWKQRQWNAIKIDVSKFQDSKQKWIYRIEVWVNDVQVTKYERDIAKGYRIGLQLHSNIQHDHHTPGKKVYFKDFSIR